MSSLGYYIYAIRGRWMDRFKIGYYIADLYSLIKRYKTYYGVDIEVYVFEIFCNKKEIQNIEKQIHKALITWNIDNISELYYSGCIDEFINTALLLTNNSVTIPLNKNSKKLKKVAISSNVENIEIKSSEKVVKTYSNINHIVRVYNTDVININNLAIDSKLLPCANGIINLETGILKNGKTTGIPFCYNGIEYPTPDIDDFMNDIFNNDAELIHFVQKLLGYGITGNNNEQCWVILTGKGSNGKGLLIRMLQKLMEKFYLTAPDQIFYKEKRSNDNSPTPYLSLLHNKRFVVKNEFDQDKVLNENILKMITGQDSISTKNSYARYFLEFTPTVLPILTCNNKPKIKINEDSETRRIIIIPFENTYAKINDPRLPYDPMNPYHKLHNDNYENILMSDKHMEQFLVWLVNGSIKWYKEKLYNFPKKLSDIIKEYHHENDTVQQFIDSYCIINEKYNVRSATFKEEFKKVFKVNTIQDDLKDIMERKGFDYGRPFIDGKQVRCFIGLKLK